MLDLLFINPAPRDAYDKGLDPFMGKEPPLLCRQYASYARRLGYTVDIFDMQVQGYLTDYIRAIRPALVVIVVQGMNPSSSTQTMPSALAACNEVREANPDGCILAVGPHPAALPEKTLEESQFDFVCYCEGPTSIVPLVEFINANSKWRWINKRDLPGLVYWDHDNLMKNDPAPNVWDLREMPQGMWDLVNPEKYSCHNWHGFGRESRAPYAAIATSAGCPFRCAFCNIQSAMRAGDELRVGQANSYRMWPMDLILGEIKELKERGVNNIKITDEMFCLNRRHVFTLCDALIQTELNRDTNIWAYSRVDTVMDDLLPKMREAGITWLCLGIESYSELVRDGIDKAHYGAEEIIKACERIREAGINLIANYIFGLPDDDLESMEKTFKLAQEIKSEYANFYSAMALPGSALYTRAVKEGWRLPETWAGYAQLGYECTPLPTMTLDSEDVLRFRDEAFQRYFTDPSYLSFINSKFGPSAVEEVKRMTGVKLKRKILDQKIMEG